GQSRAAHEEVGLWVGASSVSMLCTVGQEAVVIRETAADSVERAEHFDDARQVGEFLAPLLQPADVVVVKASRGVRAERIVRYLLDVDRMSRGAGGDCLQ